MMRDAHGVVRHTWRYGVSWADAHRVPSWWAALVLGGVLTLPWLLPAMEALEDAQDRLTLRMQQQHDVMALETRNAELEQRLSTEAELPAMPNGVAQLTTSARDLGLQTSALSVGKPSPVLKNDQAQWQHMPVSLRVHGAWSGWQQWIARWPEALPGVTLVGLDLQAQANGEVVADVSLWVPQRVTAAAAQSVDARSDEALAPPGSPAVDAAAWALVQLQSRQHASFAPWRASELNRSRQPLESVAREQLRYVGHLEQAGRTLALLRVIRPEQAALAEFHTVALGDYLGHDMGRIEAIEPLQLRLRELVRDANGAWHARTVFIPFKEGGS